MTAVDDVPSDLSVDATSPSGTTVMWQASAGDLVDGNVDATCSPQSGSVLLIGSIVVACAATDSHGNKAPFTTFTVKVRSAAEQIVVPATAVPSQGGFRQQINAIQSAVATGDTRGAKATLNALATHATHATAQAGKALYSSSMSARCRITW